MQDNGGQSSPFERDKVCFEQNFEQYRHLNAQMNGIPPISVTLTGGFWYGAVIVEDYGAGLGANWECLARFSLLIFAAVANLTLIFIAIRVRDVMKAYQAKLKQFAGTNYPDTDNGSMPWFGDYSMITMYGVLMLTGAAMSFVAAFVFYWPSSVAPMWAGVAMVFGFLSVVLLLSMVLPKWFMRSR